MKVKLIYKKILFQPKNLVLPKIILYFDHGSSLDKYDL